MGASLRQNRSHLILKKIPDPVEFHNVPRFFSQPELVKLDKEVAIEMVEVFQQRLGLVGNFAVGAHVVHVSFGTENNKSIIKLIIVI